MMEYYLILPEKSSIFLDKMIDNTLGGSSYTILHSNTKLPDLRNKKIVFAVELPITGESSNLNDIFYQLFLRGKDALYGSSAIVLIHSNYDLFTKTAAQSIIFKANLLGCNFIGRPMVEATGSLNNFIPLEKIYNMSLEEICIYQCRELGKRFINDKANNIISPKILALHSSNRDTSNALTLWDMVKANLDMEFQEINIGNGNILDCRGCPYKTCKHYGSVGKCFYGGIVVEEVYPAILESDILMFICPNYNDMIGANMVALINRLTALFRKTKFYHKYIYSIIVSGHSGSDALSKQLISSLNINKTFRLPPYFSLMATANDKGAILNVPNIENLAKDFANKINKAFIGNC